LVPNWNRYTNFYTAHITTGYFDVGRRVEKASWTLQFGYLHRNGNQPVLLTHQFFTIRKTTCNHRQPSSKTETQSIDTPPATNSCTASPAGWAAGSRRLQPSRDDGRPRRPCTPAGRTCRTGSCSRACTRGGSARRWPSPRPAT